MKLKNIFSKNARFLYSREELNDAVYVSILVGFLLSINMDVFIIKPNNIQGFIIALIINLLLFLAAFVFGFFNFMYSKFIDDGDK